MALPIRYNTAPDTSAHVAAVLYATRRTVTPFSLAERLLAQRLARLLEPLPLEIRSPSFFLPGVQQLPDHKAAWYDTLLHAKKRLHQKSIQPWRLQHSPGSAFTRWSTHHRNSIPQKWTSTAQQNPTSVT